MNVTLDGTSNTLYYVWMVKIEACGFVVFRLLSLGIGQARSMPGSNPFCGLRQTGCIDLVSSLSDWLSFDACRNNRERDCHRLRK